MSREVTSSPTSGSTSSRPASRSNRATVAQTTNSSSYLVDPRPLRITATFDPAPCGASASTPSTRRAASPAAVGIGSSETPGSPWMPSPTPIIPSLTVNSGSSAPGIVQPAKATPRLRVASLQRRAASTTASRSAPSSAAAQAALNTVKSPAMPRRLVISSAEALAMSSVTATYRVSTPSAVSRSAASPKLSTSPA